MTIPRRPGDVTAAWLSSVLSTGAEPVEVCDVDVVAIGTGQTGATYRLVASYSANPDNLPETFVIKMAAQDDTVRDRVRLGYRSEVAFYAGVAQNVAVPTPRCFYCDITDDGGEFALLLADLTPAVQGD